MIFPRKNDGEGWAWGLQESEPTQVWERFSQPYEDLLQSIWTEVEAMNLTPELGGAGSEDGEFVLGRDAQGRAQVFVHLEDPNDAQALSDARARGDLASWLRGSMGDQ